MRKRATWLAMTSRPIPQDDSLVDMECHTEREKATCERKRRYSDEPMARAFAAQHANDKSAGGVLYVYRCKVCGGWHLTKRPNGTPATSRDPFATQVAA